MDSLSRHSMKPDNESATSPVAPLARSAAGVREKLSALLSDCADREAASTQTAQTRLVELVSNCPTKSIGVILDVLLSHSETPSSVQIPARKMLDLMVRDCSRRNDKIIGCLLSKLPCTQDAARCRIIDLLTEAMRLFPNFGNKIIREVFGHSERVDSLTTESSLARLLKGASDRDIEEALDIVLHRCKSSSLHLTATAVAHLSLFATARPERRAAIASALLRCCNDSLCEVRCAAIVRLDCVFEVLREKPAEITKKLLHLCDDECAFVRRVAILQLKRYASLCPGTAKAIYTKAFLLSGDEDDSTREAATDLLVKLVSFCSEKANEVAAFLLPRYSDEFLSARMDALRLIGGLAGACSEQRLKEIADLPIRRCRIDHQRPEIQALREMGTLVKVCPDRAEEIAEIVLHWSKNQQEPRLSNWRAFLESDMEKTMYWLRDTKKLSITFRTVRANAITRLGDVAAACPGRAEEILSLVLHTCAEEDKELQLAAVSQLAVMAQVRPDKSEEIARVALRFCNDEHWKTRTMAVFRLSRLAGALTGSKGEIVSALLRACNDRQTIVRMAAIIHLPRAMQACPDMATTIFSVLLSKYASERSPDESAAEEQLEAALAACPDIAIHVLETLMAHRSAKKRRSK